MNRRVIFRPAAEGELLEAERWFEERQSTLGQRFRDSVDGTIEQIRLFPMSFPTVHGDKRRAIVPHFRHRRSRAWSPRSRCLEIQALRPNTACSRPPRVLS